MGEMTVGRRVSWSLRTLRFAVPASLFFSPHPTSNNGGGLPILCVSLDQPVSSMLLLSDCAAYSPRPSAGGGEVEEEWIAGYHRA
jgi:hypothetical protein